MNQTRLDPDWLGTFLAVAEHGGVQAASRSLGISQPALSTRIRKLEEVLGHPVFDRSASGMAITEAGKRLLPVARKLSVLMAEAIEAVDPQRASATPAKLRFSASTTLADYVFPNLIADYARVRKIEGVDLRVGNTDEVLAAVRAGRVSLGAVEGLTRASGLHLEAFAQDEIIPVYSNSNTPKALRKALSAARTAKDVAKLPILWRESGSGTRRVVAERFRQNGVSSGSLNRSFVLGGTLAQKAAALAGLGIAFLPKRAIGQELALKSLQVLQIPELAIHRTFSWVLPPGSLPPELEHFRRWVDSEMQTS
ncbi:LysR family transcriptional regulator [Pelagicoccus albus]|uniref:LysR family transcriptional regulator n=1 Tax=Pelagicoccus albus TaxID=415222 RepID=A0A7X1B637_9BACT|nr:LysR family transcriptional regulator [Pelagicoccus albus]MBC2606069.1 LysR family transcriptional regulator [Pelagicoccus albus]